MSANILSHNDKNKGSQKIVFQYAFNDDKMLCSFTHSAKK